MATEQLLGQSKTSDPDSQQPAQCQAGRAITKAEGQRLVAAAAEWAGTPYSLVGSRSERGVGGDCSGSTNKIYTAAGFPYVYQSSGAFRGYVSSTHRFVEISLGAGETPQPGDILWWPGHMAIYAEFDDGDPNKITSHVGRGGTYKTTNNMWTAFNSSGDPYGPYDYKKFRPGETPRVFRYFLHRGEPGC